MLTPVGVTTSEYWNAIKNGNQTHVRMTFLGQNIVLDESDISISGIQIIDVMNGEQDLVFGRAVSKQISTAIINSNKIANLIWTGEFTLELGVDIGTPPTTYWVNLGYFAGEKPKNVTTVNVINFTAYDRMVKFDCIADLFFKSIHYPATVQDIYDGLCTYVGISNTAGDELPDIMARSYASAPVDMTGYTCRDILAWIAEACGCYAKITTDGECKMVWFASNPSHQVTEDDEYSVESGDINDGLIWNDADTYTWNNFDCFTWDDVCGTAEMYSIEQLRIHQMETDFEINYPFEAGDKIYTIIDNPFLICESSLDINNYIAPLYNRLVAFGGYVPAVVECVGCWLVETGDIVTVGINGNTYDIPVFSRTLEWNGATNDTYEATGNRDRKVYANNSAKQKALTSKYIRLFVEDNYYQKRSGIDIEPDGVTIEGNRYIDMKSGSEIDIQAGSNINVQSGGGIDIYSGADITVQNGGKMHIESGGDIEVNTGGSLKISADGNLDVQSTNFVLDSENKVIDIETDNLNVDSSNGCLSCKTKGSLGNGVAIELGKEIIDPFDIAYSSEYQTAISIRNLDYNEIYDLGKMLPGAIFRIKQTFGGSCDSGFVMTNAYGIETFYNGGSQQPAWRTGLFPMEKNGSPVDLVLGCSFFPWLRVFATNYEGTNAVITNIRYTNIVQNSSRDIKHNIENLPSAGDKIDRLNPVKFVYDDDAEEKEHIGLIYEDTVNVMPEICTNNEANKAIAYVELIPVLLKEIQELRARVKALEEREVN